MDASEFFNSVVKRNYQEFTGRSDDFRLLWNTIVSMNTVAEHVALEQLQYAQVPRDQLASTANRIRNQDQSLIDLKVCAEALKHVRKIPPKQKQGSVTLNVTATSNPVTLSSTGVSSMARATWTIDSHDLVDVAQRAFKTLSALPELS